MTDPRADRLAVLAAIEAVLADPARFVQVLAEAEDDAAAVDGLRAAFGLTPDGAAAVLDQQFRLLTRERRARLAGEIAVLRAEWGPPLEARLRFDGTRSAVLELDGTGHAFRARGKNGVLDEVGAFLFGEVARPRLRPVVVQVEGAPAGPGRLVVDPGGTTRYEGYPEDAPR
ncbi:hypothetical protein ACI79C_11385 [Geodermatophilus sp. SYSU D00697]